MTEPFGGLRRFFRELRRRNVYKVAVTYVAVAFVGLQAVNLLIPATTLPGWADQLFLALLILGFPIALVFAWAFEMTADGMRRTPEVEGEATVGKAYRWIGLGLVILLAVGVWYATAEEGGEQTALSAASSDSAAPTSSTSRDTAGRPRIAVLPFENIARDTGDAFFARGMHEEVLNQLSKVSGLEVISRTSVMQYAETTKTVREISNELDGLNALLEGTVRRAGGRVRITTQLIEAPNDEHLWSNTYERELSPSAIFNIQAEIAQEMADALATELGEGERDRIQSAPTGSLAAYDAYLQGRNYFWRLWGSTNLAYRDSAIARLREAVRRDSTFAQAHAWLGLAYTFRSPSFGGESRWLDSAEVAVDRALSLDPDLAQAHVAQGALFEQRDSSSARIEALRRAVELEPRHAFALAELSDALEARERYVEAVRVAHRAVRLDPRDPAVHQEMADQLRELGLLDASEAWDRRALEVEPGHAQALIGLAQTQYLRGQVDSAVGTWGKYQRVASPNPVALWFAARAALRVDQPARAKDFIERLVEVRATAEGNGSRPKEAWLNPGDKAVLGLAEMRLGRDRRGRALLHEAADSLRVRVRQDEEGPGPAPRYVLAEALAVLGQRENAFRHLEQWSRETVDLVGLGNEPLLLTSPFFEELRSDQQFEKIVTRIQKLQTEPRAAREEVLQMDLDLYPPGPEPDSIR